LEFDHIYSPLPTFTFGDKRLWPAQRAGDIDLGEARVTAGLPKSLQKGSVFLAMGCVLQGSPDYGERLLNIPNWDILHSSQVAGITPGKRAVTRVRLGL
jgi:hypothetical protein